MGIENVDLLILCALNNLELAYNTRSEINGFSRNFLHKKKPIRYDCTFMFSAQEMLGY